MKQLSGAVSDLASEVVSVLRDGDHRPVAGVATAGADQSVGVAAVRVLGADVLLPSVLFSQPPYERDVALVREAVRAFPPGDDASPATVWTHWAMEQALLRYGHPHEPRPHEPRPHEPERLTRPGPGQYASDQRVSGRPPPRRHREHPEAERARPSSAYASNGREPDASWATEAPWQQLTHQLAVLGALAVPATTTTTSQVARVVAGRPVDLARGFVRAVRRRDWLQAAGAGRWLAALTVAEPGVGALPGGGVPDSLGLDAGLDFVLRMGGADPRVALHAHAAQLLRSGGAVAA